MTQEQIDLMPEINFSTNWNQKLSCDSFTTLRIQQDSKYTIKSKYRIKLKKKLIAIAEIEDIRNFFLHDLNEFVARLDTGYSLEMTKGIIRKMYPNVNFELKKLSLILLVKSPETKSISQEVAEVIKYNHWYASDY